MTDLNEAAGGGKPPAAAVPAGGRDWRDRRDAPLYAATLWPNRSLAPGGRRFVLRATAIGLGLPLVAVAGTPVVWGLVPFAAAALGMLWYALRRNQRDGRLTEEVSIWPDEMRVERRDPDGRIRRWTADPFRVRVALHADARVEQYMTLRGGGREIELGAFLSPEERVALAGELEEALTRAVRAGPARR